MATDADLQQLVQFFADRDRTRDVREQIDLSMPDSPIAFHLFVTVMNECIAFPRGGPAQLLLHYWTQIPAETRARALAAIT